MTNLEVARSAFIQKADELLSIAAAARVDLTLGFDFDPALGGDQLRELEAILKKLQGDPNVETLRVSVPKLLSESEPGDETEDEENP